LLGRTAIGAVSRLENGWASWPWGFDSLSFRLRPVAQWRRAVGFEPTRARSSRAGASDSRCDVVQPVGRPAVTRRMLVRSQPSQLLTTPRSSSGGGRRSLTSAARPARALVRPGFAPANPGLAPQLSRIPLGALRVSRSRTRLGMRPGCLPGEAGSIPVESVFSRSSTGRAPRFYRGEWGFESSRRDCVARLVASPRVVSPWSRVRFPGDAPSVRRSRIRIRESRRAKFQSFRFAATTSRLEKAPL